MKENIADSMVDFLCKKYGKRYRMIKYDYNEMVIFMIKNHYEDFFYRRVNKMFIADDPASNYTKLVYYLNGFGIKLNCKEDELKDYLVLKREKNKKEKCYYLCKENFIIHFTMQNMVCFTIFGYIEFLIFLLISSLKIGLIVTGISVVLYLVFWIAFELYEKNIVKKDKRHRIDSIGSSIV